MALALVNPIALVIAPVHELRHQHGGSKAHKHSRPAGNTTKCMPGLRSQGVSWTTRDAVNGGGFPYPPDHLPGSWCTSSAFVQPARMLLVTRIASMKPLDLIPPSCASEKHSIVCKARPIATPQPPNSKPLDARLRRHDAMQVTAKPHGRRQISPRDHTAHRTRTRELPSAVTAGVTNQDHRHNRTTNHRRSVPRGSARSQKIDRNPRTYTRVLQKPRSALNRNSISQ